jgi:hypothetical protein
VSVAHVGDSRCVLGDNGRAVALTRDHKASDPDEAKRVVRVSDGTGTYTSLLIIIIIIIMLSNQAIASTPSAPRPSGAEGRGSTAPLCLQLLRTSPACTRYSAILLEITRHLPLLPQISSDTKRNNLVKTQQHIRVCCNRHATTSTTAAASCTLMTMTGRGSQAWTPGCCSTG